jgi:hypothetical protein
VNTTVSRRRQSSNRSIRADYSPLEVEAMRQARRIAKPMRLQLKRTGALGTLVRIDVDAVMGYSVAVIDWDSGRRSSEAMDDVRRASETVPQLPGSRLVTREAAALDRIQAVAALQRAGRLQQLHTPTPLSAALRRDNEKNPASGEQSREIAARFDAVDRLFGQEPAGLKNQPWLWPAAEVVSVL